MILATTQCPKPRTRQLVTLYLVVDCSSYPLSLGGVSRAPRSLRRNSRKRQSNRSSVEALACPMWRPAGASRPIACTLEVEVCLSDQEQSKAANPDRRATPARVPARRGYGRRRVGRQLAQAAQRDLFGAHRGWRYPAAPESDGRPAGAPWYVWSVRDEDQGGSPLGRIWCKPEGPNRVRGCALRQRGAADSSEGSGRRFAARCGRPSQCGRTTQAAATGYEGA